MKVLFVCVENTCRSQMAEGFAKHLGLDAHSAGVKAGNGINPDAAAVMAAEGIDITQQYSKAIDYNLLPSYDVVISMCSAKTSDFCPSTFIGIEENWNVDDPKGQSLDVFRLVCRDVKAKVEYLVQSSSH